MTTKTVETLAQANCPYCHSNGSTRWDNRSKWGSKVIEGNPHSTVSGLAVNISNPALLDGEGHAYKIRYCPKCGRKLNGEW